MIDFILDKIASEGYFFFGPDQWGKYDEAVQQLIEMKLIISLGDARNEHDYNYDYVYVSIGNPQNMQWRDVSNGLQRILPEKA